MPLSDEEARMLQQLEQSLAAEDPDFASTLRGSKLLAHNRRVAIIAGLGFVLGLVVLFTGAVIAVTWVGIVGFLAMLASGYAFAMAWRRGIAGSDQPSGRASATSPGAGSRSSGGGKSSGSFVDRMEERWQRRQDGDDR